MNQTIIIHNNSPELKQFLETQRISYDVRFSTDNQGKEESKIISLQVKAEELTVQLEDGRNLSIPISGFELGGDEIFFPEIDEVIRFREISLWL